MPSSDRVDSGVGLQATLGIYVGAIATGLVAIGLAASGVSSGVLLSTLPTVFTAGLLVGALYAWHRPGFARRLGGWRGRRSCCVVPAVVLVGLGTGLWQLEVVTAAWYVLPVGVAAVAVAGAGWELAAIGHDAYIDSVVDAPVVRWDWRPAGTDIGMVAVGLGFGAVGLVATVFLDVTAILLVLFALMFLFQALAPDSLRSDSVWKPFVFPWVPHDDQLGDGVRGELQATRPGLVVAPSMKPSHRTLYPWNRITDLRLTEDELVLERRFRPAIRCERDAIDDPEAVLETITEYVDSE
ncbi:hypothetical protein [Salinadaptatus halalkaliphilus]|uniref:hypothetical protein n=1 Tax=Salinadaptatus halalkaliphilus TaxID=2419781 RepID=UPI001580B9A5|nr:hypothetical protein [Salinadaptatus halalkaliphilus]